VTIASTDLVELSRSARCEATQRRQSPSIHKTKKATINAGADEGSLCHLKEHLEARDPSSANALIQTFCTLRTDCMSAANSCGLYVGIRSIRTKLHFHHSASKVPFAVKDQQGYILASVSITMQSRTPAAEVYRLKLSADLTGLQESLTPLLAAQLDKDDRCGERIAIQQATLTPAPPAALATVQLHYERFACVKVFGKQQARRIVAGNAVIPVRLTPAVEKDSTQLRLNPEVGAIQADGSLGELLRSGALGEMIQEKIRDSILNAMQKGANLAATLPPAAQSYATIDSAQFQDAGSAHLAVELVGEIRIPHQQLQALTQQLKSRIAAAR
jgi:hypothetical protein